MENALSFATSEKSHSLFDENDVSSLNFFSAAVTWKHVVTVLYATRP